MPNTNPKSQITGVDLSVIVPVYNEEKNIPALHRELKEALSKAGYSWELIFVDDGSRDNSLKALRALKEESHSDPPIKIVQLSHNFGQHPAIIAGFSVANGDTLVAIDADLQTDPVHIVEMMDKIASGHDFVSGIRRGRGDPLLFRRLPSSLLNSIIGVIIGKKLRDYGCPLNAMRAEIAKEMQEYGDMQRFYKALAVKLAGNIAEVEVEYRQRLRGRSKYDFLKLVDLLFDFVTNFSRRLFQRVAIVGFGLSGLSIASGIIYLALRFPFGILQPAPRFMLIALICLTFGMQLLILGVLGDFVVRVYRKCDPKPIYSIKKIW
jgi:glycosyltransferase involved in cell wall biosynthesis